jgi:demethylmenaquinone methyltransferase/2-methoxy-6-polyprenyl-1,4-benzoquinol methylase
MLHEQITYYRERAREYDASLNHPDRLAAEAVRTTPLDQEFGAAMDALGWLGPFDDALELACGTGIWTAVALPRVAHLTALDAAPEMLEVNRRKLAGPRVRYEQVDLFAWEPAQEYDLVFFAFWLSHVPPERLDGFLDKLRRAVRPGGQLFCVDEPAGTHNEVATSGDGHRQARRLADGREFTIVKVYYDPQELRIRLAQQGFTAIQITRGDYFFSLTATRAA